MAEAHSLWGPHLDQYPKGYGSSSFKRRTSWSPESDTQARYDARDVIERISRLAGYHQGDAGNITLPMLKSVMNLASSPTSLLDLACPPLISGCVKCMASVRRFGKPSPFSYEYGYLCFRIIACALDVFLLQRAKKLDSIIEATMQDPNAKILPTLSKHTSEFLLGEIEVAGDGRRCDRVLGWTRRNDHSLQPQMAIRSDLRTLLNLLYEDRKCFLAALIATHTPGLSGVIFLFWRCLTWDRAMGDGPHFELQALQLCDILWRYLLVSPSDHQKTLMYMYNMLKTRDVVKLWKPLTVDLEDSRHLIGAYNRRLVLVDARVDTPLVVSTISLLLGFVIPLALPGCEDLLPSLFESTIRRLWDVLILNDFSDSDLFVLVVGNMVCDFSQALIPLRQATDSNRLVILKITEVIIENDFMDLILRTMLLRPILNKSSPNYVNNMAIISNSEWMFAELCNVSSASYLQSRFKSLFPDWVKYVDHFYWLGMLNHASSASVNHYTSMARCIGTIANTLVHGTGSEWAREFRGTGCCNYTRCPRPLGANRVCAKCANTFYCGSKCQAAYWKYNTRPEQEEDSCEEIAKILEGIMKP